MSHNVAVLSYDDTDIDECAAGENNCSVNAICSDIVGGEDSFQCTCNTGYTGNGVNCTSEKVKIIHACTVSFYLYFFYIYTDIDECSSNSDNCAEQATCSDTEGSFLCSCNTGYSGDGINCNGIVIISFNTLLFSILHLNKNTVTVTIIDYVYFTQILMNVVLICTTVLNRLHVITLMAVSYVHVILDGLEMEQIVVVSYLMICLYSTCDRYICRYQ